LAAALLGSLELLGLLEPSSMAVLPARELRRDSQ
jgi:hypothetical protein